MKRVMLFPPILILLFSLSSFADTVNPSTQPWSYAVSFTFPANSNYAPYYGSGIGIVETETYNQNGGNIFEAWGGTTVGNLTHFTNTWSSMPDFSGTFSNATFNSTTDVLSAMFSGSEFNGTAWVPFNGHLTETINLNGYTGGYNYSGWSYNYTEGSVTSASMSTVPEPGSLMMMGTGLIGMAGVIRRKLKRA